MEDSRQLRIAKLGTNGADKNIDRNININIKLTSSLPIISLSQSSAPGAVVNDATTAEVIEYNHSIGSAFISPLIPAETVNYLVDENDVDRFTAIGIVGTLVNAVEAFIYFDAKYNDLFMMPTQQDVGDSVITTDFFKNSTLNVEGYGIGVVGDKNVDQSFTNFPFSEYSLGEVGSLAPIGTKTHMLQIVGGSRNSPSNNKGFMFGNAYVESNVGTPSQYVSLGSSADLFGAVKVPTFRYVRASFASYVLVYVGYKNIDDMLIPLPL